LLIDRIWAGWQRRKALSERRRKIALAIRIGRRRMKFKVAVLMAVSFVIAPRVASAEEKSVLRIGILNDQSGPYSDLRGRGSVVAARMAIDDFGGQVRGRPIELLSADHQNKPDIATNIVREWFDKQQVSERTVALCETCTSSR